MMVSMPTSRLVERQSKCSFTDAISNSVIENKELCAFLFESLLPALLEGNPRGELLDFYGDDPDRLLQMWSWAKASKVIQRNLWTRPAETERDELRKRSFRRQLRESAKIFYSPQNPFFDTLTGLAYGFNKNQIGGEYRNGLTDFFQAKYDDMLRSCVMEGLEVLRLAHENQYVPKSPGAIQLLCLIGRRHSHRFYVKRKCSRCEMDFIAAEA